MSRVSRVFRLSDRNLGRAGFAMGALALFVALGGDALAERLYEKLKASSVTSKTIANNTIKTKDLRTSSVQTSDVKDGTLIPADLAQSLQNTLGQPGPQGPQGPQGPPGPATQATIADGSITNAKLGLSAVSSSKILDGTIVASDIATGGVGALEIGGNAVNGASVADGTLTAADLGANAVGSSEVLNGSLTGDDVGSTSGIVNLNFPNIADGDCASLDFTPAASVDGDALVVTPESSFAPFFEIYAEPTGADIRVQACNNFGADGNPPAADFAYVAFNAQN